MAFPLPSSLRGAPEPPDSARLGLAAVGLNAVGLAAVGLAGAGLHDVGLRELGAMPDEGLMQLQRTLAASRRRIDAALAAVAGELGRRSTRDLGYQGLAQRVGARTVEKLVSNLTGVSLTEARAMVSAGEMMSGESDWLGPVAAGVASGDLSVGAAAAIRAGLGEPNADIDLAELARAAERLARQAVTQSPEKAAQSARQVRDDIDAAGVADRETAMRNRRYLRLYKLPDGMTRVSGLLDPESAALVGDALDRVTMPRRGGVRFVDPGEKTRASAIAADTRTTEQLTVDALVQMIRLAAAIDDGAIFGMKAPAVRVHVRLSDLQRGEGSAFAEGQDSALGMGTVHRFICDGGVVPILFDDDGRSINVGRTQRLFNDRQRIAIAARDGGCMMTACDRPPAWTEAHHINEFENGGRTDIDDGIALCRYCHLWLHNTGGRIVRKGSEYWLHRGDGSPPELLTSKHPLRHAG
ncbi:MAG: DUF222 domain-containing protein [Pseudolysinimonas sp.]